MSSSQKTTAIVNKHRAEYAGDESIDDVFVISDAINECTEEDYDTVYNKLSNIPDYVGFQDIPVYGISWQHVVFPKHGGLHTLVLFAVQLHRHVIEDHPDCFVYPEDLPDAYQAIIKDIADEQKICVKKHSQKSKLQTTINHITHVLITSISILPFIIDQLIGITIQKLASRKLTSEVVTVPAMGRIKSILPIIDEIKSNNSLVVSSNTSSIWSHYTDTKLETYNPIPLARYSSIGCIIEQIKLFFKIYWNLFITTNFSAELSDLVRQKLNINIPYSTQHVMANTFGPRLFISCMQYLLYKNMVVKSECKKVVYGTHDPNGRSLVFAALSEDVNVFHIPHSIAAPYCANPPAEVTSFISGDLEKQYTLDTPQVTNGWKQIVTGRPYLTNLYKNRKTYYTETNVTDHIQILLATQPSIDEHKLLPEIIDAIVQSQENVELCVKIHPDEDVSDYIEYQRNHEFVSVADSDLFTNIGQSDLTITVNSNVGIESTIVGIPTIIFNKWHPSIRDPVYAQYGPIPVVRSKKELAELFSNIDREFLANLQHDEQDFVEGWFELDTDATKNIINEIQLA